MWEPIKPPSSKLQENRVREKHFSPLWSICPWRSLGLVWLGLKMNQTRHPLQDQKPLSKHQALFQGCLMVCFSTQGAHGELSNQDAPCPCSVFYKCRAPMHRTAVNNLQVKTGLTTCRWKDHALEKHVSSHEKLQRQPSNSHHKIAILHSILWLVENPPHREGMIYRPNNYVKLLYHDTPRYCVWGSLIKVVIILGLTELP